MEGMTPPIDAPRNAPNCGVVATAIAAGVSYNEAWTAFFNIARKTHGNWKGATSNYDRRKVLEHFGVKYTELDNPPPMTLRKWMQYHAWPSERYMVVTTGHCQMVHNGYVVDQKGLKPIDNYRWKSKRVKYVWRIDK